MHVAVSSIGLLCQPIGLPEVRLRAPSGRTRSKRRHTMWRFGLDEGGGQVRLALHTVMCNNLHMATNLAIDDELLDEALKVGGQRTKKATVTQALEEYIQHRRQADVLKLFGKVEMNPDYDYKAQRRRK